MVLRRRFEMVRGLFWLHFFLSFLKVGSWQLGLHVFLFTFICVRKLASQQDSALKNVCIKKQLSVDKGILDMN